MKVTVLKDQREKLDAPVVIVLETVSELMMAHRTFSRSIHHPDVLEDTPEQNFNAEITWQLNVECAKWRSK